MIRRVHVSDGPMLYDANIAPPQHMVCVRCGRVMDIGDMERGDIQQLIGLDTEVVDYNLVVYAVCRNCPGKE